MTGFAKRGLPRASNFLTLKGHNLVFKYDTILKLSSPLTLFWCSKLYNLQVHSSYTCKVMNRGSLEIGCVCGRPLFANLVTNDHFIDTF